MNLVPHKTALPYLSQEPGRQARRK